jgi:hypothetical protein
VSEHFATIEINGQRPDYKVFEPVISPRTGQVKRWIALRRNPSEAERNRLPQVERLARQVVGLELHCTMARLIQVLRIFPPEARWELVYRCLGLGHEYGLQVEPAEVEGLEVVQATDKLARLRMPQALFEEAAFPA